MCSWPFNSVKFHSKRMTSNDGPLKIDTVKCQQKEQTWRIKSSLLVNCCKFRTQAPYSVSHQVTPSEDDPWRVRFRPSGVQPLSSRVLPLAIFFDSKLAGVFDFLGPSFALPSCAAGFFDAPCPKAAPPFSTCTPISQETSWVSAAFGAASFQRFFSSRVFAKISADVHACPRWPSANAPSVPGF